MKNAAMGKWGRQRGDWSIVHHDRYQQLCAYGRPQRPANGRLPDEAGQEKGEEGAAEGEAPRCTSFIRGDGALFAAGIAAGLFHFLPSQTR